MDAFLNPNVRRDDGYRGLFEAEEYRDVAAFYDARRDAPPTPLVSLPGLAAQLSLGGVHLKDESARFGLSAFKIAGARYAIHRIGADALRSGIVCATAGNHGRAVARAAREIGVPCTVFLPAPHERASDLERRTRSARVEGMRQDGAANPRRRRQLRGGGRRSRGVRAPRGGDGDLRHLLARLR